jgi:aryl sulfotransferase
MTNPENSAPPWICPEIQEHINWRDQDIVISVPAKSGTTWTMNIVFQLLNGGTDQFKAVYDEVPWIEFLSRPGQPIQEILDRVEAMPKDKPRAFKTHSAPPVLPFINSDSGKQLRYIVVGRNPEEALVSFKPFLEQHTDAWFELWSVPRAALTRPDFADFYRDFIIEGGMQGMFAGFMAGWWPLRHEPNVLFLHFSDLKKDHEGSLKKIAEFLGISPSERQWQDILKYTGFDWMKQHTEKFETFSSTPVPVLETGAMIRKGKLGAAREDGMTDEISKHFRVACAEICSDQAALDWLYKGDPLD